MLDKEQKIMSKKKNLIETIKDICADESAELFVATGIDYKFDHYDSEVKAVVIKELETTVLPVKFHHLKSLERRLKEINKRITVYILAEDLPEDYNETEYR